MPDSTTNKRLEGRVAMILNAKELVVNIGASHGVTHGQTLAVLAETPIEVRDPVTGEVLDLIDREKVRVKVTEVRERISVCSTFRMTAGVDFSAIVGTNVLKAMRESRPETLRIDGTSTPPPLSEEESYVKVNDRVVAVAKAQ